MAKKKPVKKPQESETPSLIESEPPVVETPPEPEASPVATVAAPTLSKAEAVRRSLDQNGLDADLETHVRYIEALGMNIPRNIVSQYLSVEKKKRQGGGTVNISVGSKKSPRGPSPVSSEGGILGFIETLREWEKKIGAETMGRAMKVVYPEQS